MAGAWGGMGPARALADRGRRGGARRVPVRGGPADFRLDLGHLQLCHRQLPHAPDAAARARSMAAGATSSIGRPRLAAISSGRFRLFSAATVPCTTLIGFEEPSDRDTTPLIPPPSSTPPTPPPATTPLPPPP